MEMNFRTSYKFIEEKIEFFNEELQTEIKSILRTFTDAQVIECADIIEKYNFTEELDIYIMVKATQEDLYLYKIAEAEDRKQEIENLLEAKANKTDVFNVFNEYQIKQINQKFYRAKYEKTNLPKQGWIINIAVKNYEDYRRLLLNIIPELHKMQACYKITSPKMYSGGLEDVISIYLTSEFNFRNFSIKVQSILLENVNTQKNRFLMGRISAIFQNFFSTRFIDSTGRIIDSIASVTNNMLKNMSPFDILNYHETILEKYNESKNIVTYMQEYITGFPILSKKENYIFYNMYVIDNNYIDIIKEFKIYKENIDVNAIYEFTEYKNNKTPYSFVCVVVHKDFNEEMIREMIRNSIPYYQIKPTTTEDLS